MCNMFSVKYVLLITKYQIIHQSKDYDLITDQKTYFVLENRFEQQLIISDIQILNQNLIWYCVFN